MLPSILAVFQRRARARRGFGAEVLALLFVATAALSGVQQSSPQSPPLLSSPPASPQSSPSFVIEEMTTRHQQQENGSGSKRVRVTVKVADQAAVSLWGMLTFPYTAANEQVSITQLTVEKPDGRQVNAASLALEDVAPPAEMDTAILSDLRAKRIAVPALEPGDRLIYEALFTQASSLIPGQFWFDHQFTRNAVVGADGRIGAVRFIQGDERLRADPDASRRRAAAAHTRAMMWQ